MKNQVLGRSMHFSVILRVIGLLVMSIQCLADTAHYRFSDLFDGAP